MSPNMKWLQVDLNIVNCYSMILCVVLLLFDNVESQLTPTNHGGVPLPDVTDGALQGQSAVQSSRFGLPMIPEDQSGPNQGFGISLLDIEDQTTPDARPGSTSPFNQQIPANDGRPLSTSSSSFASPTFGIGLSESAGPESDLGTPESSSAFAQQDQTQSGAAFGIPLPANPDTGDSFGLPGVPLNTVPIPVAGEGQTSSSAFGIQQDVGVGLPSGSDGEPTSSSAFGSTQSFGVGLPLPNDGERPTSLSSFDIAQNDQPTNSQDFGVGLPLDAGATHKHSPGGRPTSTSSFDIAQTGQTGVSPGFGFGVPLNTDVPTAEQPTGVGLPLNTGGLGDQSIVSPNFGIGLPLDAANVSPDRTSVGRGPGSLQHIPSPANEESVRSLLNHPVVLKKIQKETSSSNAVKVESVITAHRQIVSGEITYLDLKVVETKCPIGTHNLAACATDTSEDPHICEVAVWRRPWLGSTKVIDEKSRCAEVENSNDFKNWNRGQYSVRGGDLPTFHLRSLPSYMDENQVALEAYDYVNRGSESKFKGQMVNYHIGEVKQNPGLNITTVDVKVEYGFTMCLKFPNRKADDRICPLDNHRDNYICSVTVMSDPNLTTNLKVVPGDDDDIDCEKRDSVDEELVVPVKAVCMGCPQTASLNDPSVLRAAEFAVTEYDRKSDDSELHTILKLHKAQTQVENGIKYFLTLELAETDCRKPLSAVNMNRTLCNQDFTEETEICDVIVLELPWQDSLELVQDRCTDSKYYASSSQDEFIVPVLGANLRDAAGKGFLNTAGGSQQPSTGMQSSIDFFLDQFNRWESDDFDDGMYKVTNVIKSTTKSEGGRQIDHLVLELGETYCTRGSSMANCPLKRGEDMEICSVQVMREPRLSVLSMDCEDTDDFYRLSSNPRVSPYQPSPQLFFAPQPDSVGAPGGPVEEPITSASTMDITRFVVEQFNLQSDDDELYKLGKVINAYRQVERSGSTTHTLELEMRETLCKKYQPVVDVSKCPINPTEEVEICQAEVTVSPAVAGGAGRKGAKRLNRIFCDERGEYYVKKMTKINTSSGSVGQGAWKSDDTKSDRVKRMGDLIADEFDFRSDDDNIFVLSKVIEAKAQTTGLTHQLKVELAETVCPKYKRGIDKTRCAVDIGEEHKICDATLTERPWKNDFEVTYLSCLERDDSLEEDDSHETITYRRVHPSAHARPKFVQSRFKIRQHSKESDESNERYYRLGSLSSGHHHHFDSDEGPTLHVHGGRVSRFNDDDDDKDSDLRPENDSRSFERHPSRFRFRRKVDSSTSSKSGTSSLLTGGVASLDVNSPDVQKIATFGLARMDQETNELYLRKLEEVQEATRKVVAGLLWNLKIKVRYTQCTKNNEVYSDPSDCEIDTNKSIMICTLAVWEQPWKNYREVRESNCEPSTSISS